MKSRKVMRPSQPSHLREDVLTDLYDTPEFLPPLWRVIYQEAMRGHDILFPSLAFSDEPLTEITIEADELQISEISCTIMAASDLSEMKRLIARLSPEQKKTLRRILRCTFHRWQHTHRRSLN